MSTFIRFNLNYRKWTADRNEALACGTYVDAFKVHCDQVVNTQSAIWLAVEFFQPIRKLKRSVKLKISLQVLSCSLWHDEYKMFASQFGRWRDFGRILARPIINESIYQQMFQITNSSFTFGVKIQQSILGSSYCHFCLGPRPLCGWTGWCVIGRTDPINWRW